MNSLTRKIAIGCLLVGSAGELVACASSDGGGSGGGTGGYSFGGGVIGAGGAGIGGAIPGAGGTVTPGAGGTVTPGAGGTIGGGSGGTIGAGGVTVSNGGANVGGNVGAACDPTGTWAIQFKTSVKWPAQSIILAAGNGNQTLTMLSHRTYDAATKTMKDDAQLCSVSLPQFHVITGDIHIEFPDAVFDSATPIKTSLTSTLAGDPAVGTKFTAPDGAVMVGLTLANPTTDPFPAPTSVTQADADSDTKPGVTAAENNLGVPLSALGPNADKLYLAFRSIAKVQEGTLTTCDTSEGVLTLESINQAILGCHIKDAASGAAQECDATQTKFVNDNSPVWAPDTAPSTIKTKRIEATKTCADVRTMTF